MAGAGHPLHPSLRQGVTARNTERPAITEPHHFWRNGFHQGHDMGRAMVARIGLPRQAHPRGADGA
jgi:hypothetical protein